MEISQFFLKNALKSLRKIKSPLKIQAIMKITIIFTGLIMDLQFIYIISLLCYKLACLSVGSIFCYFGFRLFMAGIWGNAGNLNANFNNNKIILKNAAPGTFFVFLGTVIVVSTIMAKMTYTLESSTENTNGVEDSRPVLP